jgi:hypothetical protein
MKCSALGYHFNANPFTFHAASVFQNFVYIISVTVVLQIWIVCTYRGTCTIGMHGNLFHEPLTVLSDDLYDTPCIQNHDIINNKDYWHPLYIHNYKCTCITPAPRMHVASLAMLDMYIGTGITGSKNRFTGVCLVNGVFVYYTLHIAF